MPCTDYRPSAGETIFVSLSGNLPRLIKVTGFRFHPQLQQEVMEFERLTGSGSTSWAPYRGQTFFPEIPIDQPYLYTVTELSDNGYDGLGWSSEEHWFFTAEEAFEFQPNDDWIVEIRKVM